MTEIHNTTYSTQDIVLAAALKVKGYELESVDVIGKKGTFHFLNVSAHEVSDYDLGKCCVEPVAFNTAIRQLTTLCRRLSDSRGLV